MADLRADGCHHPVEVRMDLCVAELLFGDRQVGAGAADAGGGCLARLLRRLEVGRADHVLLHQSALAQLGGGRGLELGRGVRQLGPGRADGELLRDRIDRGQALAFLDRVADVDISGEHATEEAEAEVGLELRLDNAGEGLTAPLLRLDDDRQHRPWFRFRRGLLLAASD